MRRRAFLTCAFVLLASALELHAASTGGLRLDVAGSITSAPAEVISGGRSIKGSYTGAGSFTNILRGDSSTLNLRPNESYRVTFRYKVLVTPDKGFNSFFVSGKGFQQGFSPVNSFFVQAPAGSTGEATFTERLANFDDYSVLWTVIGQGAIAIDDIRQRHHRRDDSLRRRRSWDSSPFHILRLRQQTGVCLGRVGQGLRHFLRRKRQIHSHFRRNLDR